MEKSALINRIIECSERYKKDEVYLSGFKKDIEYYISEYEKTILPNPATNSNICTTCGSKDLTDWVTYYRCNECDSKC